MSSIEILRSNFFNDTLTEVYPFSSMRYPPGCRGLACKTKGYIRTLVVVVVNSLLAITLRCTLRGRDEGQAISAHVATMVQVT